MIPQRSFYFIRHGETDYNRDGRFQGSIDVPLNTTGIAQAREAAQRLSPPPFTRIIASPANRVLKTASIIAECAERHIHIDSELLELHVGSFEGQNVKELKRKHALAPGQHFVSILPNDAERWDLFAPRICQTVARWTSRFPDETLLFASHGLAFRALTEHLCGKAFSSGNCVPYLFQPSGDSWTADEIERELSTSRS